MSVDELIKSFKAMMYERLTSSFGGALVISWLFFNWQGLFYISFQEGDAITKITYIKDNFANEKYNIFYPLVSALCISML